MKINFSKNITYMNIAVLILAILLLLSFFKFVQSSIDLVSETNKNNFAYTVKIRDTIEEIDTVVENAEVNLRTAKDIILLSYDTNKLYDARYNKEFTNRLDTIIKATITNSPGVDGAWFQMNIHTPNGYKHYSWFRKEKGKVINLKEQFDNENVAERNITPESDPYYFEAVRRKTTTWSDIYTDVDINTEMITISTPIYKNKKLIGVIGIDLSVNNLEHIMSNMQKNLKDSQIFILDKKQEIIMSTLKNYDKSEYDKHFSALFKADKTKREAITQYDCDRMRHTAILFKLSNKYNVIITFPDSTIYKGYERLFRTTDFIFILLVLLSIAVAYNINKVRKINRNLEDETKKLMTIFEASPNILAMKDLEGTYTWCNNKFCNLMKVKREDIIGKKVHEVFPTEIANEISEIDKAVKETKTTRIEETCNEYEPGQKICFRKHVVPILNSQGDVTHILIMAVDITKEHMEKEFLKTAKESAEKATAMKSNFLANMSHEIRTPLNGILGFMQLLQDTETTQEQAEFITDAQKSSELLLNVINDILDFSKMEADKLRIDDISFDIRSVVEDITVMTASHAQAKNIDVSSLICSDVPQRVFGDPGRIKQILSNLTNNAIKFTKEGEVVIFVRNASENEKEAVITFEVRDTGIGIEKNKLDLIFEAFEQGDTSMTRKFGGTGLGLAISKKLIDLMKGTMQVKSEYGLGSSFIFEIPFKKDLEISIDTNAAPSNLDGAKILIAASNRTDAKIVKYYLGEANCIIKEANSQNETIKILEEENGDFSTIIIDFKLQTGAEKELSKRIQDKFADIPLILYSSLATRGDSAAAKQSGFKAYLTKPFKKNELVETIATLIQHKEENTSTKFITKHVLKESKFSNKAKILVVEDSEINSKLIHKILNNHGLSCDLAINGEEAVNAFAPGKYDLIFMDCQMPVLDGASATKKIREIEAGITHTPIVALTAHAMASDEKKCYECGMDDYLSKPINIEKLIQITSKHIALEEIKEEKEDNNEPEKIIEQIMSELEFSKNESIELFAQYLSLLPQSIEQLQNEVENENYEEIKKIAHKLKGSSSNLRIEKITQLSLELEKASGEKDMATCFQLIKQIKAHCETLDALLDKFGYA